VRNRLSLAIVAGLLFCTLVALELPELLNLTDDTSNDFSLLCTQQDASAVVSQSHVRQTIVRQTIVLPARSDCKQPNERARFISSLRTPKESLHLLCALRT
jgi:hypothetical protein